MIRKLKRLVIPIVHPLFKLYWFLVRPNTYGVKCLVWSKNRILLVKLSYGHRLWTVPGGGVKRSENPLEAAKREVLEETGIAVNNLKKIGEYRTVKEYKNDLVYCYSGISLNDEIQADRVEVSMADWFAPTDLPSERVKQIDEILKMEMHSAKS